MQKKHILKHSTILIILSTFLSTIACSNFVGIYNEKLLNDHQYSCLLKKKKWREHTEGFFEINKQILYKNIKISSVISISKSHKILYIYVQWHGTSQANKTFSNQLGKEFLKTQLSNNMKEIRSTQCIEDFKFSCNVLVDDSTLQSTLTDLCSSD